MLSLDNYSVHNLISINQLICFPVLLNLHNYAYLQQQYPQVAELQHPRQLQTSQGHPKKKDLNPIPKPSGYRTPTYLHIIYDGRLGILAPNTFLPKVNKLLMCSVDYVNVLCRDIPFMIYRCYVHPVMEFSSIFLLGNVVYQ